jgi:hypothetical protein
MEDPSDIDGNARYLYRIIEAIGSGPDLDTILRGVIQLVTDAPGCQGCFVFFLNGEELVLHAASGPVLEGSAGVYTYEDLGAYRYAGDPWHLREFVIRCDPWGVNSGSCVFPRAVTKGRGPAHEVLERITGWRDGAARPEFRMAVLESSQEGPHPERPFGRSLFEFTALTRRVRP